VLLLSVVLAGCASGPAMTAPDLLQRIEAARARSDHQALDTHYDQHAAGTRAMAAEHRKMAASDQGMLAGGRGGASMPAHCNAIVRSQESIAADYEGMAAGHHR
jgi:hypothetical protein